MPRSKHTRVLQHFAAVQLITSMQVVVNGVTTYPNVDRVYDNDKDQRLKPDTRLTIHQGLERMHDLLTLVDPEVYTAFRDALRSGITIGDVTLNPGNLKLSNHIAMAFLLKVTQLARTEMWEDPPHPCTFIMREVVADLLAHGGPEPTFLGV